MKTKQEVLAFVRHLQHLYWEERNMEALIPYLDETTSWIGTGRHEICYNLDEAIQALREQIESCFLDREMTCGAFILMDLDDFKHINDRYGHLCGDRVLSEIAEIMKSQTRKSDVTARIGGDEFLAYLPGATDQIAAEVVRRLQDAVGALHLDGRTGEIRASVGASFYPKDGKDYLTLFEKADKALYFVKETDKNKYYTYEMSGGL